MSARHLLYAGLALIVSLAPAMLEPARAQQGDPASDDDAYVAAAGNRALANTPAGDSGDDGQANCAGQENVIHVVVNGVGSDQGTITADLHGDRPEEFLKKGKKLLRVRVPARSGSVRLCFQAPGTGVFAIGVYHDENANKRFDKDLFGIPAEPFGVSNNPRILFGPPSLEDSAFAVEPEGIELEITLRD